MLSPRLRTKLAAARIGRARRTPARGRSAMATEPDTADDAAIAAALADEEPPSKMQEVLDFEKRIDGDDFVGCRLRHYWAGDNAWYFARILTFDHEKRLHIVLYDDGEVHEVNLLDSNELYMIGRGCYVVKMPGHSPWPCMEWECCQALEDAGTMRMWNRRTPNKMFIIYFGTEEQGLVPVVSDEDYAEQPKKKKKVATPQKVMVKPYISGDRSHAGLGTILKQKGRKAAELRAALDEADLEVDLAKQTREDWRVGKSVPTDIPIHRWSAADAAGPVDVAQLSVADPGYDVVVTTSSLKRPAPTEKPCAKCGGLDLDLHSNAAVCVTCDKAYHLHCWGGPEILRPPLTQKNGHQWRCADCLRCASCSKTQRQCGLFNKISKHKLDGRGDSDLCKDCGVDYKAGKYCPSCGLIIQDTEADLLIKCTNCKLFTHAGCEGIGQEEYLTIRGKTHPVLGRQFLCAGGCAIRKTVTLVNKMKACDKLGLFAIPVDDTIAPTYREVVRTPMDLSTMHAKAREGQYRSTQAVRDDFELMCLNAIRFNRAGL